MNDSEFNDLFATQFVTPDYASLQTKGTSKLLVVIFVVDCSKTMEGDRIEAVNTALQQLKYTLTEIKNDNGLDLRVAIMSFASSAKWDLQLTPIEEVDLPVIQTRPGLTEYGAAFHQLNKVLRKDAYMKYTGKTAPPAIMFLTDGEPEDDYQADLEELQKNAWFTNASRSVVLVGDAIYNESAKDAVRQFVKDADHDIVNADNSTVIIKAIRLATMHSIVGNSIQDTSGHLQDGDNDTNGIVFNDPFGKTALDSQNDKLPSGKDGNLSRDLSADKDNPFDNNMLSGMCDPFQAGGGNIAGTDPFRTGEGNMADADLLQTEGKDIIGGDPFPLGGDDTDALFANGLDISDGGILTKEDKEGKVANGDSFGGNAAYDNPFDNGDDSLDAVGDPFGSFI